MWLHLSAVTYHGVDGGEDNQDRSNDWSVHTSTLHFEYRRPSSPPLASLYAYFFIARGFRGGVGWERRETYVFKKNVLSIPAGLIDGNHRGLR